MTTQHLHGQTPTRGMSEAEYETLLVHLGEQISAQIANDYPAGEAAKAVSDALANTFGTSDDQTVTDWLKAASQRVGADWRGLVGV